MTSFGIVMTENGVSTTSEGKGLGALDGDNLFPDFSLNIECVDVVKRDTGVVEATMSTVDVDLALVEASSGVGSWRRAPDERLLILFGLLIALSTRPDALFGVEPPGIVQTHSRTSMASKNEHAVVVRRDGNCYMLSAGQGDLLTLRLKLFP